MVEGSVSWRRLHEKARPSGWARAQKLKRVTLPLPLSFFARQVVTGIGGQDAIQHRCQYPERRKHPNEQETIENFESGHM